MQLPKPVTVWSRESSASCFNQQAYGLTDDCRARAARLPLPCLQHGRVVCCGPGHDAQLGSWVGPGQNGTGKKGSGIWRREGANILESLEQRAQHGRAGRYGPGGVRAGEGGGLEQAAPVSLVPDVLPRAQCVACLCLPAGSRAQTLTRA